MNKREENCFFCGYLGKDIIECKADISIRLNPFLLLDEYPENCPKKKGVVMEYKGFRTDNIVKETVDEKDKFTVKVINSADYLEISTNELEDLEPKFHKTIDEYVEMCEQYKKNPYQE